jgi:hypothetical protein
MSAACCTEACWTPVPCPECGRYLQPRGRDAAGAYEAQCCLDAKHGEGYHRHLWDEHDGARGYTDPEGWARHVAACQECQP